MGRTTGGGAALRGALLAALAGLGMVGMPAHGETLDIKQCATLALSQNPDVKVSRAQIEQAEGALMEARGHGLPTLTASLTATRTNDALNAFGLKLSQRGATFNDFGAGDFLALGPAALNVAPVNLNHPDAVTNYNTRLEVLVPLYNGGMVSGYIEQAHAMVRAAQQGSEMARQQVLYKVVQAYQGLHTARAYVHVTEQAQIAAEAYVKTTRNLLKEGVLVRSDLLTAEVNLADVQVKLEEARRASAGALDQLHLLLGLPLSQPLEIGPQFSAVAAKGEIGSMEDEAVAQNPGLQALRHQVEAAGAAVTVAEADKYPHLNAMLRQDWNDATLGARAPSYTVAGVLSWKILDFGTVRGAKDRAEASRLELSTRLQEAEEGIRYKVKDAWRGAVEAEARAKWRESALDKAAEAQRLVQKRYENGVATIVELLAAQAQLDKARADLVAARYQLTLERTALSLALGKLDAEHL
jgi:outer membrane protein TolC